MKRTSLAIVVSMGCFLATQANAGVPAVAAAGSSVFPLIVAIIVIAAIMATNKANKK